MSGWMFTLPDGKSMDTRQVLVETLVYHWQTNSSGCGCGWAVLGASWPEHVADVFEESVLARMNEAPYSP